MTNLNISNVFKNCKKNKKPALITYTVAGDWNKKKSLQILKSVSKYANILELGFPHSTPIGDGGKIQTSSFRSINNGFKMRDAFQIVNDYKKIKNSKPVILMGYYNMIFRFGENRFLKYCKKFGVDGLIVVDLPWPENRAFAKKCKIKKICFVQLLSPTTTKSRVKKILRDSHEMCYYISMLSTTGGKLKVSPKNIMINYNKIKKLGKNKNIVIGFGITTHTISSLKEADGLVCGSQICNEITKSLSTGQNPVTNVSKLVYKLKRKII